MLEFLLCSLVTIFPDFLFRRYAQGKRWGHEINLFTLWYELRWGLSGCFILTVSLITVIFYYHPSTTNVASYFRTVTILSEAGGRVEQVFVANQDTVRAGDPLFKLDGSTQEAAAATARAKIAEVDAVLAVSQNDLLQAAANTSKAEAALKQTQEELERKQALADRGSSAVNQREIDRLVNILAEREASLAAATAALSSVEDRISVQLPAQRASAVAALAEAETNIEKLTIYAGVDGRVEQFTLRVGDYVNPILRPAGLLVPSDAGRGRFQAGFGQITAQVIHPGMLAEITCLSNPMEIIPMVVTDVQDVISAGQIRPSDRLVDAQDTARPGTLTVYLEPLYAGQTEHIPPGSKCIANAYTNNHHRLDDPALSGLQRTALHVVDTVGIAHALILRIQALLLPVQTLVFAGH